MPTHRRPGQGADAVVLAIAAVATPWAGHPAPPHSIYSCEILEALGALGTVILRTGSTAGDAGVHVHGNDLAEVGRRAPSGSREWSVALRGVVVLKHICKF